MFNPTLPMKERAKVFFRAGKHYATWYPAKWMPFSDGNDDRVLHPTLERAMRIVHSRSRRLSRGIFHAMLKFGPKLERQQLVLGRLVDIGTDLFALSCAVSSAQRIVEDAMSTNEEVDRVTELVNYLGNLVADRTDGLFRSLFNSTDREGYSVAKTLMEA